MDSPGQCAALGGQAAQCFEVVSAKLEAGRADQAVQDGVDKKDCGGLKAELKAKCVGKLLGRPASDCNARSWLGLVRDAEKVKCCAARPDALAKNDDKKALCGTIGVKPDG